MGALVVLSTVGVMGGVNQPTLPELRAEIPDVREVDRNTMNVWDDEGFRQAIQETGRSRFVMLGLWTEICLAFPVAEMQAKDLKTAGPWTQSAELEKPARRRSVPVDSTADT